MSKNDWYDTYISISPPGEDEDCKFNIPILGTEESDGINIMRGSFLNALKLLEDGKAVSEYSKIILLSLASELFLKSILYKTTRKRCKTHDLYELYSQLNTSEQDKIIDIYLERSVPDSISDKSLGIAVEKGIEQFESCLAMSAMCFETLRYMHERLTFVYCMDFISTFPVDLAKLGYNLKILDD